MKIALRRLTHVLIAGAAVAATWFGQPAAASAQDLKSPALAKEFASAMANAKLEAIAFEDPQEPDRFVAAMLYPGVQLLMVAARHTSPDYLTWQIQQKQYKDVYGLLQQGGLTDTRVFFQDLGADGLPTSSESRVDVMYEKGVQTLFDGGSGNGDSKREYPEKLRKADQQYSRLLQLAIDAARAP